MLERHGDYNYLPQSDISGGIDDEVAESSTTYSYPNKEVMATDKVPDLSPNPQHVTIDSTSAETAVDVSSLDFETIQVVDASPHNQEQLEQKVNPSYGRLDKYTSIKELEAKGFPVPPVFATTEESQEWQNSGGAVLARPYFDAPWDSAIFLPGLNSKPLIFDGHHDVEIELYKTQWQQYLEELWQQKKLQGYLHQYGIPADQPPEVSYVLQGCVHREKAYDLPVTSTMLLMNNEDRTHVEWQTSGFEARSGIYTGREYDILEPFGGFPMAEDGNGRVSSDQILDLHHNVNQAFKGDKNLQVEIAYGVLKPGDKPQPYVVQARDFPQMRSRLWYYNSNYGKSIVDFNERGDSPIPSEFINEHIRPVQYSRDSANGDSYVLAVEEHGWRNDDLVRPFDNMKHLWIQGRWSRLPLMHGLFSLVELAHIRGGKVILG